MANRFPHWWRGVTKRTEKRLSRKQRLERLRISDEEFQLYKDLFLKFRHPGRFATRKEDGSWPQVSHPWKDDLILRHLCGGKIVGIPFSDRVDQIVLDIDNHGDRKWTEVVETVSLCAKALPGEPLIYRSSDSKGIRMIWFLTRAVEREPLNRYTKAELRKAGVVVENGKCEVRLGREVDRPLCANISETKSDG